MLDLPPFVQPYEHGIYAIDTGFHRPKFDAAYLMVEGGRAAFIDCGTNHSVPRLLAALDAVGLARDAVDWVIPTHVHLDHAGGTGALLQHLPAATVLVHPRGARHLVDPSALVQGATAVYGAEEIERSYGTLVPVPAARVQESHDGLDVALAARTLHLLDTPGHARHHHCVWDERSRGFFSGDTFGLSYREFDSAQGAWLLPTTTPVQFEPEALRASVLRLMSFGPQCMYLTHYGRVTGVARLAQMFLRQLDELVALGQRVKADPARDTALRQGVAALLLKNLRANGSTMDEAQALALLALDVELNSQGMAVWLDRAARSARHPSFEENR